MAYTSDLELCQTKHAYSDMARTLDVFQKISRQAITMKMAVVLKEKLGYSESTEGDASEKVMKSQFCKPIIVCT